MTRRELLRAVAAAPLASFSPDAHRHACHRPEYAGLPFSAQGITHPVYSSGTGPDVIVLHEITGPSSLFFRFTDCLVASKYRVHCPALFGTAFAKPSPLRNLVNAVKACGDWAEIDCWRSSAFSKLNPWLVALAAHIGGTDTKPLGAIGMCLTGIQPLAMLRCKAVIAPILCQPTIPMGRAPKTDLGLPPSDVDFAAARVRADNLGVLAIRYSGDTKCPPERMERLRTILGSRVDVVTLHGGGHSSLVHAPSKEAFDKVLKFLERLRQ